MKLPGFGPFYLVETMNIDFFSLLQGSHPAGQLLVYLGFILAAIAAIIVATGLFIAFKTYKKPPDASLVPQTTNTYHVYYGNLPVQPEPPLPKGEDLYRAVFRSIPHPIGPEPEPPGIDR